MSLNIEKLTVLILKIYVNSRLFKHMVSIKYYYKILHVLRLTLQNQVYAKYKSISQFGIGLNSQIWLVISMLISLNADIVIHKVFLKWFRKLFSPSALKYLPIEQGLYIFAFRFTHFSSSKVTNKSWVPEIVCGLKAERIYKLVLVIRKKKPSRTFHNYPGIGGL